MNTATLRARGYFHITIGLAVSVIVLIGFARTYYLRAWFDVPPLTVRLHLHGVASSLWLALFLVQSTLIAAGQRRLHTRLGIAGIVLAPVIIATTYAAAIEAAQVDGDRGGITAADRLYSSVVILALFGLFVTIGIACRRRPDVHKRAMLLATIATVGPGATRAVVLLVGRGVPDSHVIVMGMLWLAGLAYDWRTRGRPHWLLLYGGLVLIASQMTRRLVGGSEAWNRIGSWLIG